VTLSVALDDLRQHVERLGPAAFAVTAGSEGRPHVVSVAVGWDGDQLVFEAGNTTRGNVEAGGATTLLWPAPPGDAYSLIVDGEGRVGGATVALTPGRAVLHRLVDAPGDGPSCVKLLPPP